MESSRNNYIFAKKCNKNFLKSIKIIKYKIPQDHKVMKKSLFYFLFFLTIVYLLSGMILAESQRIKK